MNRFPSRGERLLQLSLKRRLDVQGQNEYKLQPTSSLMTLPKLHLPSVLPPLTLPTSTPAPNQSKASASAQTSTAPPFQTVSSLAVARASDLSASSSPLSSVRATSLPIPSLSDCPAVISPPKSSLQLPLTDLFKLGRSSSPPHGPLDLSRSASPVSGVECHTPMQLFCEEMEVSLIYWKNNGLYM